MNADKPETRSEKLKYLFQKDEVAFGKNRREVALATALVWIVLLAIIILLWLFFIGTAHSSIWPPLSLASTIAIYWALRRGYPDRLLAVIMMLNITLMLSYFCFISAGFAGPVIYFFAVVPTMSYLLVSRFFGGVMCIYTLLLFVVFAYLNVRGYRFPVLPLDQNDVLLGRCISSILLVLSASWVSWYYTRSYESFFLSVNAKNRELAKVAQFKSDFLSSMSHEFRTPLNAILGFSSSLSRRLKGKIEDRYLGSLQSIQRSGEHLLSLVNDILDVNEIEQGGLALDLQPVDFVVLVDECASSLSILAEEKGLKLSVDNTYFAKKLDILADEHRLRQVMMNLMDNGIKYTESGEVSIAYEKFYDQQLGLVARIRVSDTGVGIDAKELDRIFNKFERSARFNQSGVLGTGLGLVIVNELVLLHNGRIEVDSQVDKGSCFTVYLPLKHAEEHE